MAYLSTYRTFPFCVTETTDGSLVGDGTYNPVGLTKDELFQWFYRGMLQVEATTNYSNPFASVSASSSLIVAPWMYADIVYSQDDGVIETVKIYDSVANQREAGLVCVSEGLVPNTGRTSIVATSTSDPPDPISYISAETDFISGTIPIVSLNTSAGWWDYYEVGASSGPFVTYYDGYYYPSFQYSDGILSTIEALSSDFYGYGSFLGKNIALYCTISLAPSESITGSLAVTINPWWPYDPGDTEDYPGKDGSGPVYDTATGAQLRNPFAIVKGANGFYNPLYTP